MNLQKYSKISLSVLLSVIVSYSVIYAWNGLVADDGDTLSAIKWNEVIDEINTLKNNSGSPAGLVDSFMTTTCPSGYLNANGNTVSRTTYSNLFTAIGTMYGSGDGSTTFKLPDLRGYFLRGMDGGKGIDPDRATRTDRGDGTTGDNVGTVQGNQIQSHRHAAQRSWTNSGEGMERVVGYGGYSGVYSDYSGGQETRPKNINVLYCIKY